MAKIQLTGVITSMITPFKEHAGVDYGAHAENLELWNHARLNGYLVLGSGSEAAYLDEREKMKLMELTVRHSVEDRFILAGAGAESANETVVFTNLAADLGINGVLVEPPSLDGEEMNDEAQMDFFTRVADQTKIPIFICVVPGSGRSGISTGTAGELSLHPNILGMMDGTGSLDQLAEFKRAVAEDFNLMVGSAASWYPALELGIRSGVFSMANCAPNELAEIQEAYDDGRIEEASGIYQRISPVDAALTSTYGIPGLKYAVDLVGYRGGRTRGPVPPLTEEQKAHIRDVLETGGLL